MDSKEDADVPDERPSSPIWVLQQLSGEAFRVAGEALNSVYTGTSSLQAAGPVHRRAQSEVLTGGHRRNNSFQRLKSQVQKAWRWRNDSPEEDHWPSFNPEVLANQKRQWYQLHSKALDNVKFQEPTSLFENFIIAGLHPETNLGTVEDAFARRKKWEREASNSEGTNFNTRHRQGPSFPKLEPQILFKHPPGKRLAVRKKELAAFCFPAEVQAVLLQRTPSLSDLNELVYGQGYLNRDDFGFVFSLKVADNSTLYGVCLHVLEFVHRPPGRSGFSSPLARSPLRSSRFLVSAPRCYCLLTRLPFFELHFEMLNSIIAQERLNRITQFVSEMTIADFPASASKLHSDVGAPERESFSDWMTSAIPVDSAVALAAAAAGIIPDDEILSSSLKISEPESPESVITSEASDVSQVERISESCINSPEISRNHAMERLGSCESSLSPARSAVSEDEDDELFANHEKDFGDDLMMEWLRENNSDLLQIISAYNSLDVPQRGSELVFHPLEHLPPIKYSRPSISELGFCEKYLDSLEAAEVKAKLAAAEESFALSTWTTATLCRVLSPESILAFVAGALLEKQVVLVCPNLGVLSATVLSLLPMIRPFQWQSFYLPVLPEGMFDFLDAPVPYIVGIRDKPSDLKMKTSNLVHINVLEDQVKMCQLPTLPRYRDLLSELGPIHGRLSREGFRTKKCPVYKCSQVQAEYAATFLNIMRRYMESLCADLRSHTITSVQSNNDRVSLLLKSSFIDSFPSRDRPFIKLFVDTQLFSVLSDSRLSSFENEYR